ncbi:MAG: hypothetical protein JWP76_1241, partial [Dactylosporangium sp.]|nr:hypothetical protein [Dactylosporangium sp.]
VAMPTMLVRFMIRPTICQGGSTHKGWKEPRHYEILACLGTAATDTSAVGAYGYLFPGSAPILDALNSCRGSNPRTCGDLPLRDDLCGSFVLVDQAAEDRASLHPGGVQVYDLRRRVRWLLVQRTMWTVAVVVSHVLAEDRRQLSLANDEHPVGALPTYGAHPALRERVRPGRLRRGPNHVDTFGGERRPRTKGARLGTPADLAATAIWRTTQVRRYAPAGAPLRPARRPLSRLRHHRVRPDLLPPTRKGHQVRHGLRPSHLTGPTKIWFSSHRPWWPLRLEPSSR